MTYKSTVIVNPNSAHGATARNWEFIKHHFHDALEPVQIKITTHAGHATKLASQALHSGSTQIISVGGDGTHFEILNGFFENKRLINPDAVLGIYPCGTGNDLARSLGIPLIQGLKPDYLRDSPLIKADVGYLQYIKPDNSTGYCYFINSCHIGIGGLICHRVNQRGKAWGGFLSYLVSTLLALGSWRDVTMRLNIDNTLIEEEIKDIIIANGNYDGGGMRISPMAQMDNGLFEVYLVKAMPLIKSLRNVPVLYQGNIDHHPELARHFQAASIDIESDSEVMIGIDGETPGVLPASIRLLPQVLPLIIGPGYSKKNSCDNI